MRDVAYFQTLLEGVVCGRGELARNISDESLGKLADAWFMSQLTRVHYYSKDDRLISGSALIECMEMSGAMKTLHCARTSCAQSTWEAFKLGVDLAPKWERLGGALSPAEAAAHVEKEFELNVDLGAPPMAMKVHAAVLNEMDPAIYEQHCPGNMGITVGWHDIYENVENDEGTFFARAAFSVHFWGHAIPPDIQRYREHFYNLPIMASVQQELERVLGPLRSCITLEA